VKVHKAGTTLFRKNEERYPRQLAEYGTLTKVFFRQSSNWQRSMGQGWRFFCVKKEECKTRELGAMEFLVPFWLLVMALRNKRGGIGLQW